MFVVNARTCLYNLRLRRCGFFFPGTVFRDAGTLRGDPFLYSSPNKLVDCLLGYFSLGAIWFRSLILPHLDPILNLGQLIYVSGKANVSKVHLRFLRSAFSSRFDVRIGFPS